MFRLRVASLSEHIDKEEVETMMWAIMKDLQKKRQQDHMNRKQSNATSPTGGSSDTPTTRSAGGSSLSTPTGGRHPSIGYGTPTSGGSHSNLSTPTENVLNNTLGINNVTSNAGDHG